MMVGEFKTLLNGGYTVPQIAEALNKTDVAKILSKHVTEAISRTDKNTQGIDTKKRNIHSALESREHCTKRQHTANSL